MEAQRPNAQNHKRKMTSEKFEELRDIGRNLLRVLGEDVKREGLRETPERWARFWMEFIDYDPGNYDVHFEAVQVDQLILIQGIECWSLCEHHLLPFNVKISIAYIPDEKVLGLSKFARITKMYSHRLQLQERLVSQIAEEVLKLTGSEDVAVIGEGRHLCMEMRGIKTPALMKTSVLHGGFRSSSAARNELMMLLKG